MIIDIFRNKHGEFLDAFYRMWTGSFLEGRKAVLSLEIELRYDVPPNWLKYSLRIATNHPQGLALLIPKLVWLDTSGTLIRAIVPPSQHHPYLTPHWPENTHPITTFIIGAGRKEERVLPNMSVVEEDEESPDPRDDRRPF